jgi:hypothetical protein
MPSIPLSQVWRCAIFATSTLSKKGIQPVAIT